MPPLNWEKLLKGVDEMNHKWFDEWIKHGPCKIRYDGFTLPMMYLCCARPPVDTVFRQIIEATKVVVDINREDCSGTTALMWADYNDTTPQEVFDVLMDYGA